MTEAQAHTHRASHRELLLEHLFVGEVLRALWLMGVPHVEVLKPQVDDGGYDVVLDVGGVVRHVQLKTSFLGATVRDFTVVRALESKPSGCIVLVRFDPGSLEIGPFAYFGGEPGQPLPDLSSFKPARHTRANAEGVKGVRAAVCVVPLSKFKTVATVAELLPLLFGAVALTVNAE